MNAAATLMVSHTVRRVLALIATLLVPEVLWMRFLITRFLRRISCWAAMVRGEFITDVAVEPDGPWKACVPTGRGNLTGPLDLQPHLPGPDVGWRVLSARSPDHLNRIHRRQWLALQEGDRLSDRGNTEHLDPRHQLCLRPAVAARSPA
jgi:hypothetical protein